jgi:[ribosomal protein S18]-alanine N-acetyltransferase
MSAQMKPPTEAVEVMLQPLCLARLDDLLAIERVSYSFPWTRQNFIDSLNSDYAIQLLVADRGAPSQGQAEGEILGYYVAMRGYDEVHLLNLTVAPGFRGQGWAVMLLQALALWARGIGAQWLWLEVRVGNLRAQQLYARHGFAQVGLRKNYYPAEHGLREDALVMSLPL